MAWRIAESLLQLRKQINAAYPNRDKRSDGGIGDAKHASRNSDHNPWFKDKNGIGIVSAIDIDEDLAPDIHSIEAIVSAIRASKDPRVKYIIYEKRITVPGSNLQKWKAYHGANPHDHHAHISVNSDPKLYDSAKAWNLDLPKISAATQLEQPAVKPPLDSDQKPQTGNGTTGLNPQVEPPPSTETPAAAAVETPAAAMPEPEAPPKTTQQTSDVQVSEGTTAVSASTKVGGFKWIVGSIFGIVTGQAIVPEFVSTGIQSASFWTVILNIFANLWVFKVYIIGAILVIFIVRKLEVTVLKVAAMRLNADDTKGNVVLTKAAQSPGWIGSIRNAIGI